jgi:hypothetical protein
LALVLQPWETYTADTSIDLTKHHVPKTMLDKIAYYTVKSLRFPTDIFFQVRASALAGLILRMVGFLLLAQAVFNLFRRR